MLSEVGKMLDLSNKDFWKLELNREENMKLGWNLLALTTLVLTIVVAQTSSDMKDVELETTLQGQPGTTLSLALSPDGHTLASGVGRINADAVVALWDYPSGLQKRIYRFDGDYTYHDHSVRSMSFSTDSSQLVVGLGDKDVALLNVQTGALVWRSPVHSGVVFGVAYSPDGKTVASGSIDGRAVVLDAKTGQIIHVLSGTMLVVLEAWHSVQTARHWQPLTAMAVWVCGMSRVEQNAFIFLLIQDPFVVWRSVQTVSLLPLVARIMPHDYLISKVLKSWFSKDIPRPFIRLHFLEMVCLWQQAAQMAR